MKKLCLLILVELLALSAMFFLSTNADLINHANAESQADSSAPVIVRLGDGAPIPYFDGFQSQMVTDVESLRGITGQASTIWTGAQEQYGDRWMVTYELQNLTLTDDVLVAYFLARSERPFPLHAGETQHSYDWNVLVLDCMVDGQWLNTVDMPIREGHPLDDSTMACMLGFSLAEPLTNGQTLTLAPSFNENTNAWEGGISIVFDDSERNDPTKAYAPLIHRAEKLKIWDGEPTVNFDFVVERVAFTPFGNRVLINYKNTTHQNAYLDFEVLDNAGVALPVFHRSRMGSSLASPEHPVQMRNEIWFFWGEGGSSISLTPLSTKTFRDYSDVIKTAFVPMDQLPTEISLENGSVLAITNCDITKDGFIISYVPNGLTGYLGFDLTGADGSSTGFNYVSYNQHDTHRNLLQACGYWSEEYKDRIVPRVTAEDLRKVTGIMIQYRVGEVSFLKDAAMTIPLE